MCPVRRGWQEGPDATRGNVAGRSWTDRRAHPPPAVNGAWWGRSERGSLPDSMSSRQKAELGHPCLLVPRWVPGGREVHTGGSQCLRGCLTTETSDHGEDRLHRVRMRHLACQRPRPTLPCGGGHVVWRQHGVWRMPRHRAAWQDLGAATGSCPEPSAGLRPPFHLSRWWGLSSP